MSKHERFAARSVQERGTNTLIKWIPLCKEKCNSGSNKELIFYKGACSEQRRATAAGFVGFQVLHNMHGILSWVRGKKTNPPENYYYLSVEEGR